jgi:branched-chain amino acid transport system ATP-binding protein
MSDALLQLTGVTKTFGGIHALSGMVCEVPEGKIVGVIGPNGAGKTTLFNTITGAYRADAGEVKLKGVDVTQWPSYRIVREGIARTFQNIRLFGSMTVWEHLLVAQPHSESAWRRLLPISWANPAAQERAEEVMAFFGLTELRDRPAKSLPYGIQRKVEMARAVTARPKLLLLDEPVAGMNHDEAEEIRALMIRLRDTGLTILLIEHDMNFVMRLCDYLYVLDFGVLIAEGKPEEVRANPVVLDAYLGKDDVMLTIRGLQVRYGAITAVRGVDLDIKQGEIVALLGANGAGKSTIARSIAGLLPFQGDITYQGEKLVPNAAEKNLRRGIALVPEGRGILARMTVYENLLMGIYTRPDKSEAMADVGKMLERFPILGKRRDGLASLLSGGEQQMLAIGRALLSKPKLLLLDEPSLGLAPLMTASLFR